MKQKLVRIKNAFIEISLASLLRFLDKEMLVYAANAAFFIEIASIPMLILLISLLRYIPWLNLPELSHALLSAFPEVPALQNFILRILSELSNQAPTAITWLSGITALFSASSGITALLNGLRKLYGYHRGNMLRNRLTAIAYTLLFALLIIFCMGTELAAHSATGIIRLIGDNLHLREAMESLIQLVKYLKIISTASTFILILALYTLPFRGRHTVRSQLFGAIFAACGWNLASSAFVFYISYFFNSSIIYGSLTAIILLSFWLMILICIFFLGAALNKILQIRGVDIYLEDEIF